MVREVALADCEQTLYSSLKFVVYPDAAHCVVDGGEDHHRIVVVYSVDSISQFAGVYIGDFLIHVEEVAVALAHGVDTKTVDGFGEVEEYGEAGVVDTESVVATFFGGTRCHVTGHKVTECRITAFQIIVAAFFGYVGTLDLAFLQLLGVLDVFGHPYTAVVTQRLAHEGKFALLVAVHGDTCGVYLYKRGVCEIRTLAIAGHSGAHVAGHSIGREEVCVAVAASGDYHRVCGKAFHLASHQVLGDDTACAFHTVFVLDEDHVVHLVAVEAFYLAQLDLAVKA